MLKLIDNQHITDPHLNLAIEEFSLRRLDISHDYLLLYVNRPSVIVGRHQNVWQEVNLPYLREQGLPLVRRISGGGTVYHDPGNLNFSFITRYAKEHFNNYRRFTRPIIETLRGMGVPAELNERNDIVAADRKISGNAQFTSRDRMLSHGTLLFNADLNRLRKALRAGVPGMASRARQSVSSEVVNISAFLPESPEMADFRRRLLRGIFGPGAEIPQYEFSGEEWEAIYRLSREKYGSWDWNMGESPRFRLLRPVPGLPPGATAELTVERGIIRDLRLTEETAPDDEWRTLTEKLKGRRFQAGELRGILRDPGKESPPSRFLMALLSEFF